MAYLSAEDYDWDIFVSYAHVDDEPLANEDYGWVTSLKNCLVKKLAQKLGRQDAFTLWMDHELRGGQPITPNILEKLRRSAMLLAILSPAYVASEWCRRELRAFAAALGPHAAARPVFVVDLDPETELPIQLADLKRSRFYSRDAKTGKPRILGELEPDRAYFDAVTDLALEMVEALKQLHRPAASASPLPSHGTVFLAEVTDDLDEQRSNVRRYLDQAGIAVLPKNDFSLHPDTFRQTVGEGLAAADLFVQLLSEIPGKRPPDLPEGRAKCQLGLALSLGKPVLQWRSPALEIATVEDSVQRALLDGSTVRAEGIEDFKREIRRRLDDRLKPPARAVSVNAFVFVDMDSTDRPLAEQLCDVLQRHEAGYQLPSDDPDPRKFRRDLKQKIMECNALILIYGATTRSWVDGHLRELQKMLTLRAEPLRGLALVEGPPEPKDRLSIMLPKMKIINCRGGVDEREVTRFLTSLEAGVA